MNRVTSIHERAEEHLRVIRSTMERSTSFTALPGWGGVAMGLVGLAAAVVAGSASDVRAWTAAWLAASGLAVPIGAYSMARKIERAGLDIGAGAARLFVAGLVIPILAGAVLTAAAIFNDAYVVLPAVWLTLYGTATAVGGMFSVAVVRWLGAALMVLGGVAALVPLDVGNALLGIGFGALHIAAGLVIVNKHGG